MERLVRVFASAWLVFLLQIPAHGTRLNVLDDTVPYASGIVAMHTAKYPSTLPDTLWFSELHMQTLFHVLLLTGGGGANYSEGLSFEPASLSQLGFAARSFTIGTLWTDTTFSSSDTIWSEARSFPISIHPISHISTTMGEQKAGIWAFWYSSGGLGCAPSSCNLQSSARTILYARGLSGKSYKLQIIRVGLVDFTCNSQHFSPESLYVSWAVDSSGNGRFRDGTSVRNNFTSHQLGRRQTAVVSMIIAPKVILIKGNFVYTLNGSRLAIPAARIKTIQRLHKSSFH